MEKLFPVARSKVTHLVFVKTGNAERTSVIRGLLIDLINHFQANRLASKVSDIWLNEPRYSTVYDGRYQGKLQIGRDYDLVLGIEFQTLDALKHYYEHNLHSEQREKLYCAVLPEVSPLFEKLHSTDDDDSRAEIFKAIEAAMAEKPTIRRYDLVDSSTHSVVARREPIPFGV